MLDGRQHISGPPNVGNVIINFNVTEQIIEAGNLGLTELAVNLPIPVEECRVVEFHSSSPVLGCRGSLSFRADNIHAVDLNYNARHLAIDESRSSQPATPPTKRNTSRQGDPIPLLRIARAFAVTIDFRTHLF